VPAVKGIGLDANGNVWMPAARRRCASLGSGAAGGRVLRFDRTQLGNHDSRVPALVLDNSAN